MKIKLVNSILFWIAILAFSVSVLPQDRKLTELRNDFAMRYLEPDSHFALAKHYKDQGNFVQAFFILEYARRNRFEKKDFDDAFFKYFGDPMPEPPDSAKEAFETAGKFLTEQKYDQAEEYFQKANKIYDKSFFINAWTGRFYYKARSDSSKALPFYFRAYFLYPHAYETEYAEARIRAITVADAKATFSDLRSKNQPLSELIRSENPLIVGMALAEMGKAWKQEYLPFILEAMSNDDSAIRWGCFLALNKFAGSSLNSMINDLLSDNDLRKRGLAAYSVAERPGEEKYKVLRRMLNDPAEIVRFDALSALVISGGPIGKQILSEHLRVEKQPRLKSLIIRSLAKKPE